MDSGLAHSRKVRSAMKRVSSTMQRRSPVPVLRASRYAPREATKHISAVHKARSTIVQRHANAGTTAESLLKYDRSSRAKRLITSTIANPAQPLNATKTKRD